MPYNGLLTFSLSASSKSTIKVGPGIQNLEFILSFLLMQVRPRKLSHCSVTQFIYLCNKKNKSLPHQGIVDFVPVSKLGSNINPNNSLIWGYYFLSKHPSRKRCKGSQSFFPCFSFLTIFSFQRTPQRNKEPNTLTHVFF